MRLYSIIALLADRMAFFEAVSYFLADAFKPAEKVTIDFDVANTDTGGPRRSSKTTESAILIKKISSPHFERDFKKQGVWKSFGHILTLNVSKTIKEITMHLIYFESLQSQSSFL